MRRTKVLHTSEQLANSLSGELNDRKTEIVRIQVDVEKEMELRRELEEKSDDAVGLNDVVGRH